MINNFDDEYMFLSNFFELKTPITVDGLVFRTNEHFFQAYKTLNERDRIWIANQATPGAAKKAGNKGGIGRKIKLRDDWNIIKFDVMFMGLFLKFINNEDLSIKLIETAPKILVEDNWWHDNIWGNCTCGQCVNIEGQNHLGLQLMEVRRLLSLL